MSSPSSTFGNGLMPLNEMDVYMYAFNFFYADSTQHAVGTQHEEPDEALSIQESLQGTPMPPMTGMLELILLAPSTWKALLSGFH